MQTHEHLSARKRLLGGGGCVLLALALLAGCVSQQKTDEMLVKSYASSPKAKSGEEIARLNEKLFASAKHSSDLSDYLIGSGDLIEVSLFEAKELNSKVRVSARGQITLPLLGEVPVKGLSAREAEQMIEDAYRATYIRNPHVSIFIVERFSQRVTVVGQVKSPGTYDYASKQRLLDVLALAGGLTDKAGRSVQIRRVGKEGGEGGSYFVDLDRLVKEGDTDLNIEINGADVVFVPEAGVFFVDGAIRKPGSYPIRQQMTLQEALMAAGGLAPYADESQVVLMRLLPDGNREIMELDLDDDPEAKGMEIKDRDVIIAKGSGWGKLVYGSRLTFGIPGIAGFTLGDPSQ
jgi:polysaccharide export outer membrane protein